MAGTMAMTPISENAGLSRRNSINPQSRNIPLFNSPKIRRSIAQGMIMTPAILDQSTGEQVYMTLLVITQFIVELS